MSKKLMALLLCLCMTAGLLAGCTGNDTPAEQGTEKTEDTGKTENKGADTAVNVELPKPVYYYSLDEKDGNNGIETVIQDKTGSDAASRIFEDTSKEIVRVNGVKGEALYSAGNYGYRLKDVNGVGDTYTLSFWAFPMRASNYMPSIQFGPDVYGTYTGGQHYCNVTWADWSGESAFPCIWSYDQIGDEAVTWPNWSPESTEGQHVKEWSHIVLVVDGKKTTEEGSNLSVTLYRNGEILGENITFANGTMSPSDNFDFLLGVNYWDAIFKGCFDEIYVFDKALDASQVKALYAMGDQKATFVEPERIIEVKPEATVVDTLGKTDYSTGWWKDFSQAWKLDDGQTLKVKLHNWSKGEKSTQNYAMVFANTEITAHKDPKSIAGYNEYAVVRADASGYTPAGDIPTSAFTYTWGNWKTWSGTAMVDANVTLTITRKGRNLEITADNVDYNSTNNRMTAVVETALGSADPCYLFFTTENAYVDIISCKDATVKTNNKIYGATDLSQGFWTAFSDIWAVPAGGEKKISFTNYTDGANNWDNFLVILQNTPTGHSAADAEGYAEYAVVRADNWGWGAGYDNIATAESNHDFDTFTSYMDGAHVDVTVKNNGSTADIFCIIKGSDGKEYYQNYTGIATGGDLYASLTMEKAYIVMDNEAVVVGATDLSQPFWSAFSDIKAVPVGATVTSSFTNYTDGANNWDNFLVILQNTPTGHSAADAEGYAEYAVVRADNWGWGAGYDNVATARSNHDFGTFTGYMDGAHVDVAVTNNGDTADILCTILGSDGKTYCQEYTGIAVTGDLYYCFTVEKAYLIMDEPVIVGATDLSQGFWTVFSDIWEVPEGFSVSKHFTNYTDEANNWDNYLVVLQTTPTGHSAADAEGYAEYAVVRADNWGWGAGYDNIAVAENTHDFGTFTSYMNGADVVVIVKNNGATADIHCVVTGSDGKLYLQDYKGIATNGPLYMTFLCEKSYLVFE